MLINARHHEEAPRIELTPVIDMVFLLLIFFLVATTFHQAEREIEIALPAAAAGGPISMSLREIVINVPASGSIVVAGRDVSEDGVREIIAAAVDANPNQKVTIRGDRAAAYERIVRVLDICKQAGIQEPYLDTAPLR